MSCTCALSYDGCASLSGHARASLARAANKHTERAYMPRPIGAVGRTLERRAAGRTLCASIQPQISQERLRHSLARPFCSESNSESNMGEMRKEEARGAGLEAGASARGHLQKSGARKGTIFAQRAEAALARLPSRSCMK